MPLKIDPLELEFMRICRDNEIVLDRLGRYPKGKSRPLGNIDFWLPEYGIGVEVRAWGCERLGSQMDGKRGIMILIGMEAVKAFEALFTGLVPF